MFLLFLFVAGASAAATITARSPVLFIQDGKLLQNQTVTIRCDGQTTAQTTTFQNTRDGVARTVTVTCNPPKYVYELQLLGQVPSNGRLFQYESCTAGDPNAINNATTVLNRHVVATNQELEDAQSGGGGTRRRLLSATSRKLLLHFVGFRLPDEYGPTTQILPGLHVEGDYNDLEGKPISFTQAFVQCYGTGNPCANNYMATFNASAGSTYDGLLSECPDMDDSCSNRMVQRNKERALAAAEANRKAFTLFMDQADVWRNNVTGRLGTLTNQDELLRISIETNLNITKNLTKILSTSLNEANLEIIRRANVTLDMFANLTRDVNGNLTLVATNARLDAERLNNQLNSLADAIRISLLDHVGHVYQTIDNTSTIFNQRLAASQDQINRAFGRQLSENRNIYRVIRDLTDAFSNEVERRQFLADLTRRVRVGLLRVLELGLDPFLPDTGVAPPLDADANSFITLEVVRVAYVLSHTVILDDWAFVCDTRYFVGNMRSAMTWFEMLTRVGPPGCRTNSTGSCACYIKRRRTSCNERVGVSTGVNSPVFATNLELDDTTVCTLGSTTVAPDVILTDGKVFFDRMNELCRATVGVSYTLAAVYLKRRYTFFNNGEYCNVKEDELELVHDNAHPIVGILGFWEVGMVEVVNNYDTAFDYINGVMPNLVSIKENPLRRFAGQTARCITASFVATTRTWVPVYRVVPVTAEATVTVQEEGSEAVTITNSDLSTNLATLLPGAEYIVIGDPRDNVTVYDVPLEEISLAPTEYARRGKVTYIFIPTGEPLTAQRWLELNGAAMEHEAATNFPDAYKASINAQTNECVSRLSASLGSWCAIRTLFSVQPARTNSSRLEFVPRTGSSFVVQAQLSQGELTQELVSVCPVVTVLPQGAGTLVLLTNPLASDARVLVTVSATGGSAGCTVSEPVTLTAGASTSYFVPRCLDSSDQRLTIYRISAGDVVAGACAGASDVDVRSSAQTYSTTYGNVGAAYVNFTTATSLDEVLLLLQRTEVTINNRLAALLTGILENEQFVGLPLNTNFFAAFVNASNKTLSGPVFPPLPDRPAAGIKVDLSELLALQATYSAQAALNQEKFRQAQAVTNTALEAAAAGQSASEAEQMVLRNVTSVLHLRTLEYVETQLAAIDTQIDLMSALAIAIRNNARSSGGSGFGGIGGAIGGALGPVGGFLETVAKGTAEALKDGAEFVVDLAEAIIDLAIEQLDKALGLFSSFLAIALGFAATLITSIICSFLIARSVHKAVKAEWANNASITQEAAAKAKAAKAEEEQPLISRSNTSTSSSGTSGRRALKPFYKQAVRM